MVPELLAAIADEAGLKHCLKSSHKNQLNDQEC